MPAFTGLGAPHWNPDARAALIGLTRGAGRAEIARAALDSVAFQTHDLLTAMKADGVQVRALKVDGGMAVNDGLVQRLADLCAVKTVRPTNLESTAWGAAFLAGLGAGIYSDLGEGQALWKLDRAFMPQLDEETRSKQLEGWHHAVSRVL